jgi:hypothetical protein
MYPFKLNLHEETPTPTSEQIEAYIRSLPDSQLLSNARISAIVSKVRSEEKGKLYSDIEQMKSQVNLLTATATASEQEKQKAVDDARAEALKNASFEEKLAHQKQMFDTQLNQIKQQSEEQVRSVRDSFTQYQISNLRQNAALRAGLPEGFHKFVTGNTPEEITASVADLVTEIKNVTPPPVTTVVPPGTLPNTVTTPQPPTNSGVFDPSKATNLSTAEVTTKNYLTNPEERERAKQEALKIYKGLTQVPS